MKMKIHFWRLALLCAPLLGCHKESAATMLGSNYGVVLVDENTVIHQGGGMQLYKFAPDGERKLIWPSLIIRKEAVIGDLIVFNGAETDARSQIYYPALFGYSGTGQVVELSKELIKRLVPQPSGSMDYAFEVNGYYNEVINLLATQRPPVDKTKPMTVALTTSKAEILRIIALAQTNGLHKKYMGVPYVPAN